MNIQVSGKQIEIGEALRERVRTRLPAALGKYFDGGMESDDAVHAFELSLTHLEKQVRRHMRRLKSHHG